MHINIFVVNLYLYYLIRFDNYHFVEFFPLICTHIYTQTDTHWALLLYCDPGRLASGLSSGPGATGSSWGGEGGCMQLLRDLLLGPHCSVFMSVKTEPCLERTWCRPAACPASSNCVLVTDQVNASFRHLKDSAISKQMLQYLCLYWLLIYLIFYCFPKREDKLF